MKNLSWMRNGPILFQFVLQWKVTLAVVLILGSWLSVGPLWAQEGPAKVARESQLSGSGQLSVANPESLESTPSPDSLVGKARDFSGGAKQPVGRESVSVKGKVIVNGEMHEDPTISRVGMKIFVDGVLARKVMTRAEEMAGREKAEGRNFAQYVLESASEAAKDVARAGGRDEEIQEAWLRTFHEKVDEGPGERKPTKLELIEVNGLEISIRITRDGEKPWIEHLSLLNAEDFKHAPPLKSDEERAHDDFLTLIKSFSNDGLVIISSHGQASYGGEAANKVLQCIDEIKSKLMSGKRINVQDNPCRLGEEFIEELRTHLREGGGR